MEWKGCNKKKRCTLLLRNCCFQCICFISRATWLVGGGKTARGKRVNHLFEKAGSECLIVQCTCRRLIDKNMQIGGLVHFCQLAFFSFFCNKIGCQVAAWTKYEYGREILLTWEVLRLSKLKMKLLRIPYFFAQTSFFLNMKNRSYEIWETPTCR